ncbi:MAG: MFS transporter [Candidatus Lokiarchaeota archaeon]|nr:MFS transporter [Candidatus Lokiarchaeota archaeon]
MNTSKRSSQPNNNEVPSTLKMIMFSMGYFFNGFLIVAFNNFVWHYYESELGLIDITNLWPIYMAVANVIFTIFSMVSSPVVGYLTDKPNKWTKKLGFHTPWILIGGIPTIIFFFLIFTPPHVSGIESVFPVLLYYLIIVFLYDIANSLFQTHSFGAFPAHFRGDAIRRKAGMITQIFIFIANFLTIAIWSQIIVPGNSSTFIIAAFLSIIILGVSLAIFIPGSKETIEIKDRFITSHNTVEKQSFIWTMKMAIKQKNFMLAVLTYIIFMIALGLMSMNTINFVDDVLQEEQFIRTIGSIFMLIASIITMPIWIYVAKKIGHSRLYTIGLLSFGFSLFLYFFISNIFGFYIVNFLTGISAAMFTIMLSPVLADCYDEITVKTKKHYEATLVGFRNVFIRISLLIQSFIVAIIHAVTFYNPNNPVHSKDALLGLRLIQGVFPFLFCLVGAIIFYKWFDLKGVKKQEIMQQLKEMGL